MFYDWYATSDASYRWPRKFARAFAKAKTPLSKAKVAAKLLHEVVRTEGKILEAKR